MAAEGAVIQLVTRCGSEEEFIERFARFASETALVVPALPHVSVGTEGHFEICLKDRSAIMRGRCEVTDIRPVEAPPGVTTSVRALMRLRLREMDAHSCGIHLRLMERHASSARPAAVPASPPPAPAPAAPVEEVSTGAVVAVAEARSETEPTEVSPTPRLESRVPGAAFTLPANPLGELGAADLASFVELNLFETDGSVDAAPSGDRGPAAAVAQAAEPVTRAALLAARLERARRIARRVAPFAACALAGLLLGIALRSASGAAPVAEAHPAPPPPAAPPPAAPPPAAPPEELTPAIASDPDPEPTAVVAARSSRRPARVVVTSFPRRAIITLNDRRLGPAPRAIRTQRFEQLHIEASLPGYQPWQKTIVVKGPKAKVAITLVRVSRSTAPPATPALAPLARLP